MVVFRLSLHIFVNNNYVTAEISLQHYCMCLTRAWPWASFCCVSMHKAPSESSCGLHYGYVKSASMSARREVQVMTAAATAVSAQERISMSAELQLLASSSLLAHALPAVQQTVCTVRYSKTPVSRSILSRQKSTCHSVQALRIMKVKGKGAQLGCLYILMCTAGTYSYVLYES